MSADQPYRIPVVSVVGKSDSGKTGVMEALIRELSARGRRVASVKHHIHEVDLDVPGKDSWRHARAGAVTTIISAPTQFAVVRKVDRERTLEEIVEAAGDADVVLTEGFKRSGSVRIEVIRKARSDEITSEPGTLFAVVTDDASLAPPGVQVFAFEETARLVDVIESTFLNGRR